MALFQRFRFVMVCSLRRHTRRLRGWLIWLSVLLGVTPMPGSETLVAAEPEFDLVIRGGRLVDGTGAPWYRADVGIRHGRIARIGRVDGSAARVLEANDLVVAPGFVDLMGQTATPLLDDPSTALNLLTQGITTINCGEGVSAAPLSDSEARTRGWKTMAEYLQLLDSAGLPVNVVQTVGHTQVRRLVLGDVDRRPTGEELEQMRGLVREAMEAGAIGVSTALIYPPAVFAHTEEIAALAAVAGEYGGRYYTHMRNEGDHLLDAIDEALEIGRLGRAPVHIFHLKAAGRQNWGKLPLAIAKIQAARAAGQQVTADIYPYVNNGLGLAAFLPPRHFGEGFEKLLQRLEQADFRADLRREIETTSGWENWYRHVGQDWNRVIIGRTVHPRYSEHAGKSLAEIARACQEDPWDTFFQLVRVETFALPESMTEANLLLAMRQDFVSFCTDVGPAGGSSLIAAHPRAYGAFPRLLSRYVRDLGVLSLERAVAQASAAGANAVMAYDRGRLAEGQAADVIVFDFAGLADKATFAQPHEVSAGMKYVVVNGKVVLEEGRYTGQRPGRVLRGPGYRPDTAPPAVSTGAALPGLEPFDHMLREFLTEHRAPGVAVAVTDQGRLVYARGFGYADVAARQPVQPTTLFRIASISKPLTAVAILQLVEQGRLRLDDKVFDILPLDADLAAHPEFDARHRAITIRHLLEHRGGWDRGKSFDGMFQSVRFARELAVPPPAEPHHVIRAMLKQRLDFDPGERYAYSNYGYCLLGRVIEQRTGQTYEAYVRQHVLAPLGIHTMRIGRTLPEGRQPGEARYYDPGRGSSVFAENLGQECPWPYGGWYLEAMDAHGGWIASAVDLARFAVALDTSPPGPLLAAESLAAMAARPEGLAGYDEQGQPKDVYYGLGWQVRDVGHGRVNLWHTGSLSGTATILIRKHDGRCFVALFNTRGSPTAQHLGNAIDGRLHQAADQVRQWPQGDLFPEFFPPAEP
jgi:N-acyl-D-amino-acid deacylase